MTSKQKREYKMHNQARKLRMLTTKSLYSKDTIQDGKNTQPVKLWFVSKALEKAGEATHRV